MKVELTNQELTEIIEKVKAEVISNCYKYLNNYCEDDPNQNGIKLVEPEDMIDEIKNAKISTDVID